MEGGFGLGGREGKGNKGLEGTGLNLPVNRHGNLTSASSDENLKDIFHHIRTSKTPSVDWVADELTVWCLEWFSALKYELTVWVLLCLLMNFLVEYWCVCSPFGTTLFLSFLLKISKKGRRHLYAVINYGASWCHVCSQILPPFCQFSNKFPKLSFVYADIDECPETTQHIRYTPTFHFYRDGERVDEMFGAGEERLHDRLWLHS